MTQIKTIQSNNSVQDDISQVQSIQKPELNHDIVPYAERGASFQQ